MSVREWWYLDSSGAQKGPIAAEIISRMLERGVGLDASTLVWRAGTEKWLPLSEVEPFADLVKLLLLPWHYVDAASGSQRGPFLTRMLLHKLKSEEIDGMTLVYTPSIGEWKVLHEVALLKEAIAKVREEEAELGEAERRAKEVDAAQQVYVVDEEGLQRLVELRGQSAPIVAASTNASRKMEKKSFVANDGVRYMWDEDEQGWVEDDEEGDEEQGHSDDDPDCEDEEAPAVVGGAADESKKRKKKNRRRPKKQGSNLWVYVTGLPHDATAEEVKAHFSKVGLIALSATDQQPKIKLYLDEAGGAKGDCSLCYVAEESVQMAVDVLSGGFIRPSFQVLYTNKYTLLFLFSFIHDEVL
jgi:hypothetical protein